MTADQTLQQPSDRISWRSVAALAALMAVPGLLYGATVLLPYYAGDLDALSLAALADGAEHARWPTQDSGVVHLFAFFSLLLAPLGTLLALGGCVVQLLPAFPRDQHRVSPGVAAGLGVVAVACLGSLSFFLSPLGRALTSWQLD